MILCKQIELELYRQIVRRVSDGVNDIDNNHERWPSSIITTINLYMNSLIVTPVWVQTRNLVHIKLEEDLNQNFLS